MFKSKLSVYYNEADNLISVQFWGHHGHVHMVVGFLTTYAISTYHH